MQPPVTERVLTLGAGMGAAGLRTQEGPTCGLFAVNHVAAGAAALQGKMWQVLHVDTFEQDAIDDVKFCVPSITCQTIAKHMV